MSRKPCLLLLANTLPAAKAGMRRVIMALTVVGVYLAARALQIHYSTGVTPCSINDIWDCGAVNRGPYSVFYGVPVALIGILGYIFLFVMEALKYWRVMAVASIGALGFSLYLTHIEASVLQTWCQYCVGSLITISLITLLSIVQLIVQRRRGVPQTEATTTIAK
jgi:vitamin-K-epoxide reductase (warfarin-sensitive)